MISTIITAGGTSSRFGGQNKLLYKLEGKPIIMYSVSLFDSLDFVDEIIVSVNSKYIAQFKELFKGMKKVRIVEGGSVRQESVYNALKECKNCSYVIIHDGARPFIKKEIIIKCLEKAKEKSAAIVAVKTIDTIKIADSDGKILSTPQRSMLWNAQTPQIFEYSKILMLHEKYKDRNFTDDALLFEQEGLEVYIQEGDYSNIKITTLEDIKKCK